MVGKCNNYISFYNLVCIVKPPAKIWTLGSAGTLATARTHYSRKASNSRTTNNSMFERNSRNPNTLATPGTSAIAERLATGNHQELKERQQQQGCLPLSGCKQ
jgi:hypothetical protein